MTPRMATAPRPTRTPARDWRGNIRLSAFLAVSAIQTAVLFVALVLVFFHAAYQPSGPGHPDFQQAAGTGARDRGRTVRRLLRRPSWRAVGVTAIVAAIVVGYGWLMVALFADQPLAGLGVLVAAVGGGAVAQWQNNQHQRRHQREMRLLSLEYRVRELEDEQRRQVRP